MLVGLYNAEMPFAKQIGNTSHTRLKVKHQPMLCLQAGLASTRRAA